MKKQFSLLVGSVLFGSVLCLAPSVQASSSVTFSKVETRVSTQSTSSILSDVVKGMEPALTNFLTTYTFDMLNSTMDRLEKKYRSKRLDIDYNISSDSKLFVTVLLSGKKFCYRNIGSYRIKLTKSTRCK